jgi:hypothetical protein
MKTFKSTSAPLPTINAAAQKTALRFLKSWSRRARKPNEIILA